LYLKRVSSARVRSEVVALYRSVRTATQISPDFIPGVDPPSAIFPAEKSITEVAIRRSRTIFRGRGKTSSGRNSPECRSVDMNFLNASWIVRPHSVIQALPGGFPKGADFLVEAMTEKHSLQPQRNHAATIQIVACQLQLSVRQVDLILRALRIVPTLPAR